mgnify:CR=1 FL=1
MCDDPPIENQTPTLPGFRVILIIQVYPHDTSFYTQGLTFYKGELYEGTGDPGYVGQSRLMKIDLKTGTCFENNFSVK